MPQFGGPED